MHMPDSARGLVAMSELLRNPASWDLGSDFGILPCRFGAPSEFDYNRCCLGPRETENLRGCFAPPETEERVQFARDACCDDRASVATMNHVVGIVLTAARCFNFCGLRQSEASTLQNRSWDCGCEVRLLKKLIEVFQLPQLLRRFWQDWIVNTWSSKMRKYTHERTGTLTAHGIPTRSENSRQALRLLEHALLMRVGRVPEPGEPFSWVLVTPPGASRLHEAWSLHRQNATAFTARKLLHPKRLRKFWRPRSMTPVHIAMIASVGMPLFGQHALGTIRSALFHAKSQPLHFHLFVDTDGEADVRRAVSENLEADLRSRAEKFEYHGTAELWRIDLLLKKRIPEGCLQGSQDKGEYGSPGWMRLFPHEIFAQQQEIYDLIWVDAGDYLFFADPANLLEEHVEVVRAGSATAAASYPYRNVPPVQIFALDRMRREHWSDLVEAIVWREWNINAYHLCYRGEGSAMVFMTERHPDLFLPVSERWAHEPRLPWFSGALSGGQMSGGYKNHQLVYLFRDHPGLSDPMHAFIFCPGFADSLLHTLAIAPMTYPIFSVEFAQVLMRTLDSFTTIVEKGVVQEAPSFGPQRYVCGTPVFGLHLIRQFHKVIPWSVRLLDFWSASPGLWGAGKAVKRKLPGVLSDAV